MSLSTVQLAAAMPSRLSCRPTPLRPTPGRRRLRKCCGRVRGSPAAAR